MGALGLLPGVGLGFGFCAAVLFLISLFPSRPSSLPSFPPPWPLGVLVFGWAAAWLVGRWGRGFSLAFYLAFCFFVASDLLPGCRLFAGLLPSWGCFEELVLLLCRRAPSYTKGTRLVISESRAT